MKSVTTLQLVSTVQVLDMLLAAAAALRKFGTMFSRYKQRL